MDAKEQLHGHFHYNDQEIKEALLIEKSQSLSQTFIQIF